mgnify:CR=1 FL=1
MQRLLLVGLNHATAPLEIRERVAFPPQRRDEALAAFRCRWPQAEAVLLSTCNRVELYTARPVHGHPRWEQVADFLAAFHSTPVEPLRPHLYHRADRDAVLHLFTVASSLDSMVLGETQILGQVREAYDASCRQGSAGALLHPLFQRAVAVGKQVRTQTAIGEGRVSIASVAVDYARRVFDHFADKTVLCIGAGKMASLVLKSFSALHPGRLIVCNRDHAKAEALASRFGGEARPLDALDEQLVAADVVISSTGATDPIIARSRFEPLLRQRRYRPIFLIDVALPRDIEAAVGELDNVYLYNIDDLQQVVSQTRSQRGDLVAEATAIVEAQAEEFEAWHRARELGPLIERLSQRYHGIAQEELQRTLRKLGNVGDAEREHLEDLTRRIVNKLLHDPIQSLRKGDGQHAASAQLLHALERLFHLQGDDEPPGPQEPPAQP